MVDKHEGGGEYEFAPAEPVPQEAPSPAPATPSEALPERICPHCGFRIVGKALRGRCPECAAVLDEQTTDRLQFSDAHWLATVSNGTLIVALAMAAQSMGMVLGWLEKWPQGALTHAVAAVMGALGVWLATKGEPGTGTVKSKFAHAARWAAVGVAVMWLLPVLQKEQAGPVEGKDVLAIVVLAAMALEAAMVALHLRTLAMRVPNDSLVAQFLNLAYLVPGVCLVLVVLQLIGRANIREMGQNFFLCGVPIVALMGAVLVWTAITLLRLGIELRNCVAAGQAIEMRKAMKAKSREKK